MQMVTRVAMAIASSQLDEGDSLYDWYALTEEVQDDFLATARAAIEAMRLGENEGVPGGMAFEDAFFGEHDTVFHAMRDAWNATIDAALSQTIGEK